LTLEMKAEPVACGAPLAPGAAAFICSQRPWRRACAEARGYVRDNRAGELVRRPRPAPRD
jgi:hypothetical protein